MMRIPLTPDGASWIAVMRGHVPMDADAFARLWDAQPATPHVVTCYGKTHDAPRRCTAYGRDYTFSGNTLRAHPMSSAPASVQEAAACARGIDARCAAACLVNFYDAAHGHYIAPHSDDERELARDAPVVSVSWCRPTTHWRRFRLQPKKHCAAGAAPYEVELHHGDVVVMGGTCQDTHTHELRKPRATVPDEAAGHRINVTFRAFV